LGTGRKGRQSAKVADFVLSQIDQFETELIDVRDWAKTETEKYPESQEELREKMEKADGLIIVSPEYNSGYPGELKILLDTFYAEYDDMPVGVIGVSAGGFGGVRMIEKLRPVLINMGMKPIGSIVTFKNVEDLFDDKNNLKEDIYLKFVNQFLEEMMREVEK